MSSKSVAYVKEKRVAALLNDMVEHLLASRPKEPLGALIALLESKSGVAGTQKKEKMSNGDEEAANSTAAKTGPQVVAPRPPDTARPPLQSRPHSVSLEDTTTGADDDDEKALPMPPSATISTLLAQLGDSEAGLADLLEKVLADRSLSREQRAAASEASAHCNELKKYTEYASQRHATFDVALEQVRSALTPAEFRTAKGFKLLRDLDRNERLARQAFAAAGLAAMEDPALSKAERALLAEAKTAHEDMLSLLDDVEARQVEVTLAANRGSVNAATVEYFARLSDDIANTYGTLRSNAAGIQAMVPVAPGTPASTSMEGAVSSAWLVGEATTVTMPQEEDPSLLAMPLEAQAEFLVSQIRTAQAQFEADLRCIGAPEANEAAVSAAIASATLASREMQTLAGVASNRNQALANKPTTYSDTCRALQSLNAEIASKLLHFRQSHAAAMARIGSAVASRAVEGTASTTASLQALLGESGAASELGRECLAAQAEIEKLVGQVAEVQAELRAHGLKQ